MRLDLLLVRRGFASSRQRAQEMIKQGQVLVADKPCTKAGSKYPTNSKIRVLGEVFPYPSRAGLKLEKALRVFDIDICGKVVLDVGASTGGFTSCLLQAGAQHVLAVDVGRDQLVEELRKDSRVSVFEGMNIRDLTPDQIPMLVDIVTVDVSFISLTKVLPSILPLLKIRGEGVLLVKPQFETGGVGLNKQGVIHSQSVHLKYLPPLINQLQGKNFGLLGFDYSPISGAKGNIEYLAHFRLEHPCNDATDQIVDTIRAAWKLKDREGKGRL